MTQEQSVPAASAENSGLEQLITLEEAARYCGLDVDLMLQLNEQGQGPRFLKLPEGMIRYRRSDLDGWFEARREVSGIVHAVCKKFSLAEMAARLLNEERSLEAVDDLVTYVLEVSRRAA